MALECLCLAEVPQERRQAGRASRIVSIGDMQASEDRA
jgi:hypothetical protein